MITDKSKSLFEKATHLIPGGVNSPVRAFKSVGGNPLFIKKAKGSLMFDEDGNQFVDYINSWGPMILGHAHPRIEEALIKAITDSVSFGAPGKKEVEIAELITSIVPSIEKIRMVNSGTEATMSAIRLARGYTNKNKFIKFEGCYHGHGDSFLIAAGSGAATMGVPDSPGVTPGTAKDTLTAKYNNLQEVEQLFVENKNEIAAIIVEPVAGNMGCVLPEKGFLEGLRKLCTENNAILIFDEVMTGFRLSLGGAQELLGVQPDLTTFGKIIGGGLPVGAYGGKAAIMDYISPQGPVYQAGTLSGNPIAMTAGIEMLSMLKEDPEVYKRLESKTLQLKEGFKINLEKLGLDYTMNHIGSMISLFFTKEQVTDFDSAKTSDTLKFGTYFRSMLEQGIYLAPSQFESLFISDALSNEQIEQTIKANYKALNSL